MAIDNEIVARGGSPLVIAVAQPLPQGLNAAGFGGPMPPMPFAQTAMFSMSVPTFLRDAASSPQARRGMPKTMPETRISEPEQLPENPEALLRQLARMQKINGSWNDDVEWTSAALLAFLRHGHTPRAGSYRRQISNALAWLKTASAPENLTNVRDAVLAALDGNSGAAKSPDSKPVKVNTLEMLREAALENRAVQVPSTLLTGKDADLARIWLASISDH